MPRSSACYCWSFSVGTSPWAGAARHSRTSRFGGGTSLHRPEPGEGSGVLQRRAHRGADHLAQPSRGYSGRRPDLLVSVQGPARRRARGRPPAGGGSGAGGQRAQERKPAAGHGAAEQRKGRLPALVGLVRPRPGGRLRGPGGDRAGHRLRPAGPARRRDPIPCWRRSPPRTSRRTTST